MWHFNLELTSAKTRLNQEKARTISTHSLLLLNFQTAAESVWSTKLFRSPFRWIGKSEDRERRIEDRTTL